MSFFCRVFGCDRKTAIPAGVTAVPTAYDPDRVIEVKPISFEAWQQRVEQGDLPRRMVFISGGPTVATVYFMRGDVSTEGSGDYGAITDATIGDVATASSSKGTEVSITTYCPECEPLAQNPKDTDGEEPPKFPPAVLARLRAIRTIAWAPMTPIKNFDAARATARTRG